MTENLNIQCDFCHSRDVKFRYRATSFGVFILLVRKNGEKLNLPWSSVGDWAACEICSDLYDAGEWDKLAARSVDTLPNKELISALLIEGELKRAVKEFHQEARKHIRPGRQPA